VVNFIVTDALEVFICICICSECVFAADVCCAACDTVCVVSAAVAYDAVLPSSAKLILLRKKIPPHQS